MEHPSVVTQLLRSLTPFAHYTLVIDYEGHLCLEKDWLQLSF